MGTNSHRVGTLLARVDRTHPELAMELREEVAALRGEVAKYRTQLRQERALAGAESESQLRELAGSYAVHLRSIATRLDKISAECGVLLPGPALDLQRAAVGYLGAYGARQISGRPTGPGVE